MRRKLSKWWSCESDSVCKERRRTAEWCWNELKVRLGIRRGKYIFRYRGRTCACRQARPRGASRRLEGKVMALAHNDLRKTWIPWVYSAELTYIPFQNPIPIYAAVFYSRKKYDLGFMHHRWRSKVTRTPSVCCRIQKGLVMLFFYLCEKTSVWSCECIKIVGVEQPPE